MEFLLIFTTYCEFKMFVKFSFNLDPNFFTLLSNQNVFLTKDIPDFLRKGLQRISAHLLG